MYPREEYAGLSFSRENSRLQAFKDFSSSQKKKYGEWLVEAKTDETRQRRPGTAIDWIAEGKTRNWKYLKK